MRFFVYSEKVGFEIQAISLKPEVIEYLVTAWKYRELVIHSVRMYELERGI